MKAAREQPSVEARRALSSLPSGTYSVIRWCVERAAPEESWHEWDATEPWVIELLDTASGIYDEDDV